MIYYSFTSLSTVGFGDFHPISDSERAIISLGLLCGVATFSMVLGNFMEIMEQIKVFGKDYDDKERLSGFFSLLRKYNDDNCMDPSVTEKIEAFFEHKWKFDKNNSFHDQVDLNILIQLPHQIQYQIFHEFLFIDFFAAFKQIFTFQKRMSLQSYAYFTWKDDEYSSYMSDLVQKLCPLKIAKGEKIYQELDDVNEVIFVMSG